MRTTHTPGPWRVSGSIMERKGFINPMIECGEEHEPLIAELYGQDRPLAEKQANALLMAKAPALRDALERLAERVEQIELADGSTPDTLEARALLMEIEGDANGADTP